MIVRIVLTGRVILLLTQKWTSPSRCAEGEVRSCFFGGLLVIVPILLSDGLDADGADEEAHEAEDEEGVEFVCVDGVEFVEGECAEEKDCSGDDGGDSVVARSGLVHCFAFRLWKVSLPRFQ